MVVVVVVVELVVAAVEVVVVAVDVAVVVVAVAVSGHPLGLQPETHKHM